MHIRKAERDDVPEMMDIYNEEVLTGVATFDTEPRTLANRMEWFAAHNVENHPLLVAEQDGRVAGYASLSTYRPRGAFNATVELSVYVSKRFRRQGVATQLMRAILELARQDERTHLVVSVITGENQASIALHRQFGFSYCGTLHEVGRKFGRLLNVDHYELRV